MARAFNGVQLLVLGGAGIGAFYAAAHLSQQEPKDADAIVAPAVRPIGAAPHASVAGESPHASDASPRPSYAMLGAPPASAPTPSTDVHGDRSAAIPGTTGQAFATMSWVAPPPPPPRPVVVAPAPPAPPVAPPLPFAFVGMVEKGTPRPQAFLSKGDALLVVSLGDTIDDGAYRVDAMTASQIVFTHLPTNTKQIITLTGGSQ
jgi:hypothetical protein